MVWIVFKRQTLAIMVEPTTASVQIGVRGTAGAMRCIFFRKCFCPKASVRLQLINFPDAKFAVFKVRTSPQRVFDLSL